MCWCNASMECLYYRNLLRYSRHIPIHIIAYLTPTWAPFANLLPGNLNWLNMQIFCVGSAQTSLFRTDARTLSAGAFGFGR